MKLLSFLAVLLFVQLPPSTQPSNGVLWRDPGPIASRDLFWGDGSEARAPKPPFTFVEEKTSGSTPKVIVSDAHGEKWHVKFSSEAHAEVAAARLLWAFGYPVQEMYYVHEGRIDRVKDRRSSGTWLNTGRASRCSCRRSPTSRPR